MAIIGNVIHPQPNKVKTAGLALEYIPIGSPVIKVTEGTCKNATSSEHYPILGFSTDSFVEGDVVTVISDGRVLARDLAGGLTAGDLLSADVAGIIANVTEGKAIAFAEQDSGDALDLITIKLNAYGVKSGTHVTDEDPPVGTFVSSSDTTNLVITFGEDIFSDALRTPIVNGDDLALLFDIGSLAGSATVTEAIYNDGFITMVIDDTDLLTTETLSVLADSIYDAMGNSAILGIIAVVNADASAWESV
jgi:hypothetical protein